MHLQSEGKLHLHTSSLRILNDFRWSISLFCFIVYFIFVFIAFMNRPFSITTMVLTNSSIYYWDMKSTIDPAFLDFSVNPSLQNMYSPRPVNSYKEFSALPQFCDFRFTNLYFKPIMDTNRSGVI